MTLASLAIRSVGILTGLALAIYVTFQITPWPSALIIRRTLDTAGLAVGKQLAKHAPADIVEWIDERYDAATDALLDVYTPPDSAKAGLNRPTVVWVHGGSWVAGDKKFISGYLKILASKGYTAVGVNYSLAPGKTYPTPVKQINEALSYLTRNADRLHVDPTKFVLAGDSSGAQIAAQTALVISSESYAKSVGIVPSIEKERLRATILYCGFFDGQNLTFGTTPRTILWSNLRTMFWSYLGERNFQADPRLIQLSIPDNISRGFPSMFISVGNADKLAPQSYKLAEIAESKGILVDRLFFPITHSPALYHEYQFDLDTDAGKLALARSLEFLAKVFTP